MNLIKRLSWLGGLAILAVVMNHSVQWGVTLANWSFSGGLVSEPLAPWVTYLLLTLERLPTFCVPAFFFITGFFLAFSSRSAQGRISWKIIRARLIDLIVPYLIWSVVYIFANPFEPGPVSPVEFFWKLAHGGALAPFFFVPLLAQFYLVAPFLVPAIRRQPRLFLALSFALQIVIGIALYADVGRISRLVWYLILSWSLFFVIGVYAGLDIERFKAWLQKYRTWILVGLVPAAALAVIEAIILSQATGRLDWIDMPFTPFGTIYSLLVVFAFLLGQGKVFGAQFLTYLSTRTYGVYLTHSLVLILLAYYISEQQWMLAPLTGLIVPFFFVVGVAVPLIAMWLLAKTSWRTIYRSVFG